jgi:hypothetical protein
MMKGYWWREGTAHQQQICNVPSGDKFANFTDDTAKNVNLRKVSQLSRGAGRKAKAEWQALEQSGG